MKYVDRYEVEASQREWEDRRKREVTVGAGVDGQGFTITGLNLRSFHDFVGPEASADYLQFVGELEVVEPTIRDRLRRVAHSLINR